MRKYLTIALVALSLCSCSALDAMNILNPDKPSVEVNANVGKNVEQEKSNIKIEQGTKQVKQDADTISNDTAYKADVINQITQNIPVEYIIIMVFLGGWAIPSFSSCVKATKDFTADVLKSLVVNPIKGLASFILQLKNG
jgi:uncharacterized protein YcfL